MAVAEIGYRDLTTVDPDVEIHGRHARVTGVAEIDGERLVLVAATSPPTGFFCCG